jgi:hypothetical protein
VPQQRPSRMVAESDSALSLLGFRPPHQNLSLPVSVRLSSRPPRAWAAGLARRTFEHGELPEHGGCLRDRCRNEGDFRCRESPSNRCHRGGVTSTGTLGVSNGATP